MNKEKIGKFLKNLRKNINFSQNDLVNKFNEYNINISTNSISLWEKGETIPDIEKLNILSKIYNISIEEILDGEIKHGIDFSEEYYLSKPNWGMKYIDDKTVSLYQMRNDQQDKIKASYKRLLNKAIVDTLTSIEEKEFAFIINNFFSATDYKNDFNISVDNLYLFFIRNLYKVKQLMKGEPLEEVTWEINKYLVPKDNMFFKHYDFVHEYPKNEADNDIKERINKLEFWEKDMLLMTFQIDNYLLLDYDNHGSFMLKKYEEETNEEYNKEKIIKNIIKTLIDSGAKINNQYMNFYKVTKKNVRIIDRLEELYISCKAPIIENITIDGKDIKYSCANTQKNRFIHNYYYVLRNYFDYSFNELFNLFTENEVLSEDMVLNAAIKHNINIEQEYKYILSDISNIGLVKLYKEYKNKEKEIENNLIEYDKLLYLLESKQKYYNVDEKEYIGGTDWDETINYFYYWNQFVSIKELISLRDNDKTQHLLEEIDKLTLKEIKEKYFTGENRYE